MVLTLYWVFLIVCLLLKIDSFLKQNILIIVSPPLADPSSSSLPLSSFPEFPHFGFSLLILFSVSGLEHFYFFLAVYLFLTVCVFLYSFRGSIHFFFKNLNHIHKGCFKIFVLCFSHVRIFRTFCARIAGFWWRYTALTGLIVF